MTHLKKHKYWHFWGRGGVKEGYSVWGHVRCPLLACRHWLLTRARVFAPLCLSAAKLALCCSRKASYGFGPFNGVAGLARHFYEKLFVLPNYQNIKNFSQNLAVDLQQLKQPRSALHTFLIYFDLTER